MKLIKTMQNFINKYPLIGNGSLILLVAGSVFIVQHTFWGSRPPILNAPMTLIWALLAIIPLLGRWLFLIMVLMFIIVAVVTVDIFNVINGVNLSSIASILVIFSAAAYGGRRRNFCCVMSIITFNIGLIYKLMFSGNVGFLSVATLFNVFGLFWNLVTFLAIWRFGTRLHWSREQTFQMRARTDLLVREREDNIHRVVFGKCIRIARKLHDVFLRFVSIASMQAGTVQHVLEQRFEKVLNAFSLIGTSNRQLVTEPCCLPGFVQEENMLEKFTTQPGLQHLEEPVSDIRIEGFQLEFHNEGEKREIIQIVDILA